ncbi:MAG: TerC family protein [Rhizobiaceae bacterium]
MHFITPEAITAFFQVIAIDLVLAGDNAVVIGLAAAGLPKANRGKVILIGILAATALRIAFAVVATEFLKILGLLLAGGLLLLWVCWKLWRDLRQAPHDPDAEVAEEAEALAQGIKRKTFGQAVWQIVVADLSMSLDNVLAVAGAARDHPLVLAAGLILSIALMGLAASFIAKLLHRHRWIAYLGLAVILYVSLDMIVRGALEVWPVASNAAQAVVN